MSPTTHDHKPLTLPKLVAARKSSKGSLNMSDDPTCSIYSTADSGFYSASECSTPPTPSQYARGHFRFPSAASSLSSSPPTHDPIEPPNSSGKLPKLTEEPLEREYDYGSEDPYRCSCKYPIHPPFFLPFAMLMHPARRRPRLFWPCPGLQNLQSLRAPGRVLHHLRLGTTNGQATTVARSIRPQHHQQA